MSCCFIDFESVQRQQSVGGGPVSLFSPTPSTHTLPASALQVPCLAATVEIVKIHIVRQGVNLEQRGIPDSQGPKSY